jgi:hypothetical protein
MGNITLKSVGELRDEEFLIPCYQRGYRWSEQQVKDLLEDILDFMRDTKDSSEDCGFYCLQPLVVRAAAADRILEQVKMARSLDEARKLLLPRSWEVIDGQQRLTTLYILLSCLEKKAPYRLEYQTRPSSTAYLEGIADVHVDVSKYADDNIDSHYMARARTIIRDWLDDLLLATAKHRERCRDRQLPECGGLDAYRDVVLNHVKVIWYETEDQEPIKVFARLNIGKIPLTNAELVKALFLRRGNFDGDSDRIGLRQREITNEWDGIERALRDDDFWLFLNNEECAFPTRIDFIFDLIRQRDDLKLEARDLGDDAYRTFRYFDLVFRGGFDASSRCAATLPLDEARAQKINRCWSCVKRYDAIFREWYEDQTFYHYIGYLIAVGDDASKVVRTLLDQWQKLDKDAFKAYLRAEIKRTIQRKCPSADATSLVSDVWLSYLDYQYAGDGSDKGKCRPILLFHNIQTVLNQNAGLEINQAYGMGVVYKFPFHLYKREHWDVEHISSMTDNRFEDESSRSEWLSNVYLGAPESVQTKILAYFDSPAEEAVRSALFKEIRSAFPEEEHWSLENKNRIMNYVLLDSSTNRGYGNTIFSGKRRVIISKDKGVKIDLPQVTGSGKLDFKTKTAVSSFVPPCTRQVFLKYYSAVFGKSNEWTLADAAAYRNDILDCLNKLGGLS